jgi:hypothetical protein
MKINWIELKNHGPYKDKQIIRFEDGINIFKISEGSTNGVIFNILKQSVMNDIKGIKVSFEGNIEYFKKYIDLIFIDNDTIIDNMESSPATAKTGLGDAILTSLYRILSKRSTVTRELPLIIDADDIYFLNQQHRANLMDKIRSLNVQVIIFEKYSKSLT